MNSVNPANASNTGKIEDINLGPADSLQLMFVKLQLVMSAECKVQAERCMNQIRNIQAEQEQAAIMIELAQRFKVSEHKPSREMTEWMGERNMKPVDNDTREAWDVTIRTLANYQESIGSQQQTLMTFLQDFMGQYSSYLQGASAAIGEARSTLGSLIRA